MADKNPLIEVISPTRNYTAPEIRITKRRVENEEAHFAMEMIQRWGPVMAMPDGEDSAGRARNRGATPEEVVERAVQTAALAYQKFEELGWIVEAPSIAEADDILKEQENEAERQRK